MYYTPGQYIRFRAATTLVLLVIALQAHAEPHAGLSPATIFTPLMLIAGMHGTAGERPPAEGRFPL